MFYRYENVVTFCNLDYPLFWGKFTWPMTRPLYCRYGEKLRNYPVSMGANIRREFGNHLTDFARLFSSCDPSLSAVLSYHVVM